LRPNVSLFVGAARLFMASGVRLRPDSTGSFFTESRRRD
jgi:hypothetical protein